MRLYSNCGGASHPLVQIKDDRKMMYKEWLDQVGEHARTRPPPPPRSVCVCVRVCVRA